MYKEKGIGEFEPSWGSMYAEEYRRIKKFATAKYDTMYFDYPEGIGLTASVQLRNFIKRENLPLKVVKRKDRVYILRKDDKKC